MCCFASVQYKMRRTKQMKIKLTRCSKTYSLLNTKRLHPHFRTLTFFHTSCDFLMIYFLFFILFCTHRQAAILNKASITILRGGYTSLSEVGRPIRDGNVQESPTHAFILIFVVPTPNLTLNIQ